MDTIKVLEIDTISGIIAEPSQPAAMDPNPFAIFVMGMVGIFGFVLLYMLIMKIANIIIKKNKKNE